MSLDFFVFLLKRYFAMFQSKYNGVQKKLFVSALKFSDIPNMIRLNVRGVFDKKLSGDDLPAEVQDTLIVFERIFQTHA